MQYPITPKAAILGMKNNMRRYLSFDFGLADFSSII